MRLPYSFYLIGGKNSGNDEGVLGVVIKMDLFPEDVKKSYEVLARKYRPGRLSELIGQDALVRTLTNAINMNRIPHAFILTGIRGVGKTSTARIIARSLICTGADNSLKAPTTEPCGICENCLAIAEDRHVDIMEMDAASRTGVNDIREIIDNVYYAPVAARYKIYIIDEVHMLSKNAFNALLKTLEEPPAHTKFIFATTEIRKIPVTILSRCMRFDLPRVDTGVLSAHLKNIAIKENANIADDAASLVAHVAEGSVRDALSLLDQAIGQVDDSGIVNAVQVKKMLGLADRGKIFDLFENLTSGKPKDAVITLREIYAAGGDAFSIIQDLMELCHFVTQLKIMPDLATNPNISEQERERSSKISAMLPVAFLSRIWQMLVKGVTEVQMAQNPMVAAEMLVIRIAYSAHMPTPGDLVKDIKDGNFSASSQPNIMAKKTDNAPVAEKNDITFNPISFSEMVELFKLKNENFIHKFLQEVHPVSFDSKLRKVEFRPVKTTPADLAGKIGNLLSEWTSNRWIIVVSNSEGQKSMREEMQDIHEERKNQAMQDGLVMEILKTFPGARVVNVTESDKAPNSEVAANEKNDGMLIQKNF